MNNDRLIGAILVIICLVSGLIIGRVLGAVPDQTAPSGAETFRVWFWSHRSIDLAVQVGLIFAGALGVAAVLPSLKEEDT